MPTAPVPPRRVAVVGAGMAGLCTAWFLQEQGIAVTVLERTAVAAGASAGNAGWITPALVAPLPDPVILREGRARYVPSAAVYLPRLPGPACYLPGPVHPQLHAAPVGGRAGRAGAAQRGALSAFDELAGGGAGAPVVSAPGLADRRGLLLAGLVTGRPAPELRPFDPLR